MKRVIKIPIEDEIRSQFSMMSLEQENVKWSFSKKRNDLGLEVIKQIDHDIDGSTGSLTTIKD